MQTGLQRSADQVSRIKYLFSWPYLLTHAGYDTITLTCTGDKQKPLEKDAGEQTIAWLDKIRYSAGSIPTSNIRLNMQRVMQNNAAVFRTQDTLEEGMP